MPERKTSPLIEGLHILVLGGFALAQPVFDLLSRNAGFFVARGSQPVDVFALTGILSLVGPGIVAAIVLASRRVNGKLHDALLGSILALSVAIISLPALKGLDSAPGGATLAIAIAMGAFAAVTYFRSATARAFLTVLIPALLIFPALFLFHSPVRRLLGFSLAAQPAVPRTSATAPVVMLVFDELPLPSLLDEDGAIDPIRYPNFAAFARQATWYRNATAVSDSTLVAIPSLLTGVRPEPLTDIALTDERLPTADDYPRNLFTLLGGSHAMNVFEIHTRLCPPSLCGVNPGGSALGERLRRLLSDVGTAYLHIVLPTSYQRRLPPVTGNWSGFTLEKADGDRVLDGWGGRLAPVSHLMESLSRASPKPGLFFLHVLLPHAPWNYLPSGQTYTLGSAFTDIREDEWTSEERWTTDEATVIRAYQRHLLQVGFVDHLLGQILERLRTTGLYDRSLIVVASDHGASFRAGGLRRRATQENLGELMPVPLIIKAPGQKEGTIDERNAELVDVLPTVADLLGATMPWRVDGRSLQGAVARSRDKTMMAGGGEAQFAIAAAELSRAAADVLRLKIQRFGSGARADGLFSAGPHAGLVGRSVASLTTATARGLEVKLSDRALLDNVDPESDFLPVRITGRLRGVATLPHLDLAIAVNGTIRATASTIPNLPGESGFSTLVPAESLQRGRNDVKVFVISGPEGGERLALAEARAPWHSALQRLVRVSGRESIASVAGPSVPVIPGHGGYLQVTRFGAHGLELEGWAADATAKRPADAVLVFVDGRLIHSAAPDRKRSYVAVEREAAYLEWSGFALRLPLGPSESGRRPEIRVFALNSSREARELEYPGGYPFLRP